MKIHEKLFCSKCEIVIGRQILTKKPLGHEFKSGWLCDACAIQKVKRARGDL